MNYSEAEENIKKIISKSNQVLEDVVSFLHDNFENYSWVGIYIVDGDDLILGPWKGPHATEHTRIPIGKGICGAAAETGNTEIIDDVKSDDRYLSCFISTKSEIVVPIYKDEKVIGEIDIDSDKTSAFTDEDKIFLEKVADMISSYI